MPVKQRGFSMLVEIIMVVVVVGAVLGAAAWAWGSFKDWIGKPYADAQREAAQKVVDKANGDAKAAELERDNARADTAQCTRVTEAQSREVVRWQAAAEANRKAADAARAKAAKAATEAAPRIADLQAKATAAPKLMACEEELGKAKKLLTDVLRGRR
jgi:type II secretory pathway pseudopilin PulG